MGYQFWLSYLAIISFMVYSGLCVGYYSAIAKEKMENGSAFCPAVANTESDDIAGAQTVAITLLTLSVVIFVLKINHDVFAKCDYTDSKATGFFQKTFQNTAFWWSFLVLSIYAITIYNLSIVDRFSKCDESVTDNGGLIAINSIVVGIISIMILLSIYWLVKGEKNPFFEAEAFGDGGTSSLSDLDI